MPSLDYDLLRELVAQGLNNCEIARRLGCGDSSVGRAAERLGLRKRQGRKSIDVPLLFQLWNAGVLKDEIARRLGISVSHLSVLKNKHGLPKRKPMRQQADTDPTPQEIEERAAECRARRVHSEKMHPSAGIRQYRYSSRTGVFTPGDCLT